MKIIVYISALITVLGSLNWGLIGIFDFNAIEHFIFYSDTAKIIYGIIGIAAAIFAIAYSCFPCPCGCNCKGNCCCCQSEQEKTEEKKK